MNNFSIIQSNLLNSKPFCFIKINDGEARSILKENISISRGSQEPNQEMSYKLFKTLTYQADGYMVGIPCKICYPELYLKIKKLFSLEEKDYPANLLINSNFDKTLTVLKYILPKKRVFLICGEDADISKLFFKPYNVLRTPEKNSWSVYKKYKEGYKLCDDGDIVLFCCGPVGRCLASKWYKNNNKITCLELGSFFDPWMYSKAYMYHTSTLPFCEVCNNEPYQGLNTNFIKECKYVEKYYWTNPSLDMFKQMYKNDTNKIIKAYEILYNDNSISFEMKYYIEWMLALLKLEKENNDDEIIKLNEKFLTKYPTFIEAVYYLSTKFTNAKLKIKYLWKLIDVIIQINYDEKILSQQFRQKELYEWKIFHELVIDCYYNQMYQESYDAWMLNMKYKKFPDHVKEICIDNGRYAKMVLEDMKSYEKFNKELNEINIDYEYTSNIPKLFHFIYIKGGHEFLMTHYIAIKSCKEVHLPHQIFLYTNVKEEDMKDNIWWQKTQQIAKIINITIPTFINNHGIPYPQHKADLMRICILKKFGGVYMDIDALSVAPFTGEIVKPTFVLNNSHDNETNLYSHSFVICQESKDKLCNCVLLSRKDHEILNVWLDNYLTKYGNKDLDSWSGLSVMTPYNLILSHPEWDTTILETPLFLPFLYNDTTFFYNDISKSIIEKSMVVHLWDTEMLKYGLIPKNIDYFSKENNTFTKLFQKYICTDNTLPEPLPCNSNTPDNSTLSSFSQTNVLNPC